jgi:hypothetical protein
MKPLLAIPLLLSLVATLNAAFVPDFKIKPDDYTVLMAVDAKASPGLGSFQGGAHGKFFIHGWNNPDHKLEWTLNAPQADSYAANILIQRISGPELRLNLTVDGKVFSATLPADATNWQRIPLGSEIPFTAGSHEVSLAIQPAAGGAFEAKVHAVEFVRPAVKKSLHETALRMREKADTAWFQDARYGIMVTWTNQSVPRQGDAKSYAQAVADFDVEAFADQMKQTGAGFVLLATSHAYMYFPAPLASLDKILPGRTAKRDLVADLAAALEKRNIKLMLYYHLGAWDDGEWLNASGFWKTDTSEFFGNWQRVISEAGERYKTKLVGWWFDDGSTNYYYRSAPWEKLARAAKAGNPGRLIGFNSWELNTPTEFHDYYTGEGLQDPRGFNQLLVKGGNGRYPSGTHQGLQASACFTVDGDWVHSQKDRPIVPPNWSAEQLSSWLKEFAAYRNVPIFNFEIYQEGIVSDETVKVFREAAALVGGGR